MPGFKLLVDRALWGQQVSGAASPQLVESSVEQLPFASYVRAADLDR